MSENVPPSLSLLHTLVKLKSPKTLDYFSFMILVNAFLMSGIASTHNFTLKSTFWWPPPGLDPPTVCERLKIRVRWSRSHEKFNFRVKLCVELISCIRIVIEQFISERKIKVFTRNLYPKFWSICKGEKLKPSAKKRNLIALKTIHTLTISFLDHQLTQCRFSEKLHCSNGFS